MIWGYDEKGKAADVYLYGSSAMRIYVMGDRGEGENGGPGTMATDGEGNGA